MFFVGEAVGTFQEYSGAGVATSGIFLNRSTGTPFLESFQSVRSRDEFYQATLAFTKPSALTKLWLIPHLNTVSLRLATSLFTSSMKLSDPLRFICAQADKERFLPL